MELNQFRDVDLVIDKANDNFIQRQFVSQGDFKGRTLTVQITDNGVIGEIPGVTTNLYWTNQASGLTDLSAFTLIDKANSVFRLEYPQQMMTPGKVIANIQVIQNGQATHLKPFELTVQKLQGKPVGIFDKAEYSALVAVLADSNKLRSDIDVLGNNKVDKGGNEQVTLPMLSQEVKESMTGGSVAVVAKDGVNTTNIVDNGVTSPKRTELGEQGYISGSEPVEVDLIKMTINFSPSSTVHRVYFRKERHDIATQTVDFGKGIAGNGIDDGVRILLLFYKVVSKSISLVAHNYPDGIDERDIFIGTIVRDLVTNRSTANLNGRFSYKNDVDKPYESGMLVSSTPLNFSKTDRIMRIYPNTFLISKGSFVNLNTGASAIDINFPATVNTKFIYAYNANTAKVLTVNDGETVASTDVIIASISESSANLKVSVNGEYTINGLAPYAKTPEVKYVGDEPAILDVVNRTLVFPPAKNKNGRLFIENRYYILTSTNSTVSIPTSVGGLAKIWFNTITATFRVASWTDTVVNTGDALVCVCRMAAPYSITLNGDYTIDDGIVKDEETSDLKMLSNTLEDSITSWWVHPLAKNYKNIRDKMYLSYTDGIGYSGVISVDNVTGKIVKKRLKQGKVDDHNAVAIEIMQDGKIIAAYAGGHNEDTKISVRISKRPESIEDFENEISIDVGGETTYAQIFFKNNKWFIFFRFNTVSWSYISSPDGLSWSSPVRLITSSLQYYCKFQDILGEENLKVAMYSNPNSTDTTIRCAVFNTDSLKLELIDGTELGVNDINKDSVPILIEVEEGKKNRLLDLATTERLVTKIIYCEFVSGDAGLYKVYDTGNKYGVAATGQAFYLPSGYFNGAVFKDSENVIISRGESGIDLIELYSFEDSVWQKRKEVYRNNLAIRPTIVEDKVICQIGYFNNNDYTDFLTDFKISDI